MITMRSWRKLLRSLAQSLKNVRNWTWKLAQASIHPGYDESAAQGWKGEFEERLQKLASGSVGLSDSIRRPLRENSRKWQISTQVHDALIKSGFDFGNYASNPPASIQSTLKRLKPEEAERDTVDAVMAWRWKRTHQARVRRRHRNPFFFGKAISITSASDLYAWADKDEKRINKNPAASLR
jgi:hypothetical protein